MGYLEQPHSFLWIMAVNLESRKCLFHNAALTLATWHYFCCVLSSAPPRLRHHQLGASLKGLPTSELGNVFPDKRPTLSLAQLNPITSCYTPVGFPKQFLGILTICPLSDTPGCSSGASRQTLAISQPDSCLLCTCPGPFLLLCIPYPSMAFFCKSVLPWCFG